MTRFCLVAMLVIGPVLGLPHRASAIVLVPAIIAGSVGGLVLGGEQAPAERPTSVTFGAAPTNDLAQRQTTGGAVEPARSTVAPSTAAVVLQGPISLALISLALVGAGLLGRIRSK